MKYILILLIVACAMATLAAPISSSLDTLLPEGLTAKQDEHVFANLRDKRHHGTHLRSKYSSKFSNRVVQRPSGYKVRQRFHVKSNGPLGRIHHHGYSYEHYHGRK